MREAVRGLWVVVTGLAALGVCGCFTANPLEYVAGTTGDVIVLANQASVEVLTPVSHMSVAGGTQVDVNWRAFAETRSSTISVIFDEDNDPNNDNEVVALSGLPLTQSQTLVDTTRLAQGTYWIGVLVQDATEIAAFGYAPGAITIDQRPELFFLSGTGTTTGSFSARDNVTLDRTSRVTPTVYVAWELDDPDSTNTVEVYLDPDESPNGNEILLFTSTSQTGDSFAFDLPAQMFTAGTYRILAVVTDGRNAYPFYAPGRITLRNRLAGYVDLRDLDRADADLAGAVFEGFNPGDNAGSFVSTMGDLDGDGRNEFVIVAQFGKPNYYYSNQRTGIGEAYVIYGREQRYVGAISVNSTGVLFRGDVLTGVPEVLNPIRPSRGITSFTGLSDWDNDGIPEMAFGVPFTDSSAVALLDQTGYFRTGAVIVVAGSSLRPDLGFPGGVVRNLAWFGTLPHMAATCMNCDLDNRCPCAEGFYGPKAPSSPGCSNTYFHRHWPVEAAGDLDWFGCRFSSADVFDQFGETVSMWAYDSIVISAPNRDPVRSVLSAPTSVSGGGVVSMYFVDVIGGFYPWTNDNSPPANQDRGYRGSTQSTGDGVLPHGGPYHYVMDDIEWTPGYYVDPDDSDPPCDRVIDARMDTFDWSTRFWSNNPGARLSNAKGCGDMNADGIIDLLIGAPFAREGAGACFIVLGRLRDLVRGGELQLEELALPMNAGGGSSRRIFDGIQIVGEPGDSLGQTQDSAGDFNGDGIADVVLGSPLSNNRRGGAAVFFGSREAINLTQREIPYTELPARNLGVIFVGDAEDDMTGARVTGARDVDGDGLDDLLIVAPNKSVKLDLNGDGIIDVDRTGCGAAYLVYGARDLAQRSTPGGQPGVLELKYIGTPDLPGVMFIGQQSGDYLAAGLGGQGDRSYGIAAAGDVDGDGASDLLMSSVSAAPRDRAAAGEVYLIYGRRD